MVASVFGLGEGGNFHHPPRLICGVLNRHFCQLKISEAKPVICGRAIILSSNFYIQFNQKYQLP
jgi:hypothetical protein